MGVNKLCEIDELRKLSILLSAASFAFSDIFVISRQVSRQHSLLLKIKF